MFKHKFIFILLIPLVTFSCSNKNYFPNWNTDSQSLNELKSYVNDVTNQSSKNFVPFESRIAVFDLDGTLFCETAPTYIEYAMYLYRVFDDPNFEPNEEQLEIGNRVKEFVFDKKNDPDLEHDLALVCPTLYSGMSLNEYNNYVRSYINRKSSYKDILYKDLFYLPMLEIVSYLKDNNFKTYVCSGTNRFLDRVLFEENKAFETYEVIGTDIKLKAKSQGEEYDDKYNYLSNDELILTDELLVKNVMFSKVGMLEKEIGKKPILSFGNSAGDISMHRFSLSNSNYISKAFMLVHDDNERENTDLNNAQKLKTKWDEEGYISISIKNDFKNVF